MIESLYELANINNEGVEYLNDGCLQEALKTFKISLKIIATKIRNRTKQGASIAASGIHPLPPKMEEYLIIQPDSQVQFKSDGNLLHTQGFRLTNTSATSFSSELMEEMTIHCAIVVFNLAIVFHLHGLQDNCQVNLRTAKDLYERSLGLIAGIIDGLDTFDNEDTLRLTGNALIDLFVITLWNNKAHISLTLKDFTTSAIMFGKVIRCAHAIRRLTDIYVNSGIRISAFMEHQSQRFLLNAKFCPEYHSTTAPMA